ncbi:nucleoside hydrolase [Chryseolinea soli]|uniref:Nucleoside hydrolase n=1 Tax=Chryseolinea soli TaxID=2321403 RepID=A0A385SEZ8_9BACT|nr:nucleoside hydrolase [Chryseolinea soli]AYB29472.1 nucleoside hydrolase [Chryseolinea soli]
MRLTFLLLLLISVSSLAQRTKTVKIILDTDFGNDCDDAAALAVLHQLAYHGEAEILGVVYPMNDDMGAPAIDAENTYYGKPNIPVGTYKGTYEYKDKHNDLYNSKLAELPNDLKSGKNAPDAVALYRKILAAQPDQGVTIVVVGPQRLVADLLQSKADSLSPLDGTALVKKKVLQLVVMGTAYPKGHEWNIRICPDAAQYVEEHWPTPVVYSGLEIGIAIMTGERLFTETPENNPVRIAFGTNPGLDAKKNRHSWDQTAVLYAVRGVRDYWTLGTGFPQITEDGKNSWVVSKGNRHYLIAKKGIPEMKKILEDMMVAAPK